MGKQTRTGAKEFRVIECVCERERLTLPATPQLSYLSISFNGCAYCLLLITIWHTVLLYSTPRNTASPDSKLMLFQQGGLFHFSTVLFMQWRICCIFHQPASYSYKSTSCMNIVTASDRRLLFVQSLATAQTYRKFQKTLIKNSRPTHRLTCLFTVVLVTVLTSHSCT